MHSLSAETADFKGKLLISAQNLEGGKVPLSRLSVTVASDNETAITVIPDPGGDKTAFTIHVEGANPDTGEDNIANLNVEIRNSKGVLLAAGSEQFVINSGDATVAQIGFQFDVDNPAPPPPPPDGGGGGTGTGGTGTGTGDTGTGGAPVPTPAPTQPPQA